MLVSYFCPGVQLMCGVTVYWYTGENQFSLPSRYQLQISSWSGVGLGDHLPFLLLGFCLVWICAGLVCADTVPVCSCLSIPLCLEDLYPPPIRHHPFFHIDPWALREGLDDDIPFRTVWPKISLSVDCPVVGLHAGLRLRQEVAILMSAKYGTDLC